MEDQYLSILQSVRMKAHQRVLELHPHLSKLIDSLCFELAVNIPDENSLSLLDITSMRSQGEITNEQSIQLYHAWLQARNVYDLFSAKQIRIFPKQQLLTSTTANHHLQISSVNSYLELLHQLYDQLYQMKDRSQRAANTLQEVEELFSYLDFNGNIHLRLSQMFFLHLATLSISNQPIPSNYDSFRPTFKAKNKEFCQIQGMVSLRWFKNYFLFQNQGINAGILSLTLKDIQKNIRSNGTKSKAVQNGLPNILEEAFARWKSNPRFAGIFQAKKKKLEVYHRIFEENQEIFFFNGGKDEPSLNEGYFAKKYGQQCIRSLQIDTNLLKQFESIVKQILNEYLGIISRVKGNRHHKSQSQYSGSIQTPHSQSYIQPSNQSTSNIPISHRTGSNPFAQIRKQQSQIKHRTPTKSTHGNDTKRNNNITPSGRGQRISPIANRLASTSKSVRQRNSLTPNKNQNTAYSSSLYVPPAQVYKFSKKQGLQKDSFYQKLFFFRNKRVESFDIVMRRLKGK